MEFTSLNFAVFLAAVFGLYWGALRGTHSRNLLLLGASWCFYGWVHPWYLILIATSTFTDFYLAQAIQTAKRHRNKLLVLSVVLNLGLLATFKYFGFFIENVQALTDTIGLPLSLPVLSVALPVGISFYTFQSMSYVIDVWRRDLTAEKNPVTFALYISFFPQLIAGPVERGSRILPQLRATRHLQWEDLWVGAALAIKGYFVKLVIADNLAPFINNVFALKQPGTALLATAAIGFGFQIYCDFLAYSLIAKGVARVFGIQLIDNFNSPYLAWSPTEFWRRWHMSLSCWFRDYVYIPLGGSRNRLSGMVAALLVTFLLSGLWHGAAWTFVAWGLWHGIFVALLHATGFSRWRPTNFLSATLSISATFLIVTAGWLIFRAPSLTWLGEALTTTVAPSQDETSMIISFMRVFVAFVPFLALFKAIDRGLIRIPAAVPVCYGAAAAMILFFSAGSGMDFIYFRF